MGLIHHLIDFPPHSTIEDIEEIWPYTKFAKKKTGPDKSASFEFPTFT